MMYSVLINTLVYIIYAVMYAMYAMNKDMHDTIYAI